jgi:hypothetical protein
MITDDMSIPSSASLAYRGGGYAAFHAVVNFAITEFSEVQGWFCLVPYIGG